MFFLNLDQLWDINMDSGPVATFHVHDYLRPKVTYLPRIWLYGCNIFNEVFISLIKYFLFNLYQLCDLYDNDSIFDKFGCCVSGDGLRSATGSYRFIIE